MRILSIVSLIIFVGQFTAFSQINLDEVNVTAKTPARKSLQNTTTSGSILTDSLISQNAHLTLSQLLSQQTGVVINGANQTAGSVQTVYFRGASRGLVLILINGIPVSDGSDIDQVFDLNSISLHQVKRIEILRGGQSVVYGSDAIGGVINIITRDSPKQKLSVSSNVLYGSFNSLKAGISISGASQGFTYQAAYNRQSTQGISAATDSSKNASSIYDKDSFKRNALNLDLRKTLGNQISVYSSLRYAIYEAKLDASAFIDDLDNNSESSNLQFGFGADYSFKKGMANFSYNRFKTERVYEDDSTDIPESAFNKYSFATYGSSTDFFEAYTNLNLSKNLNILIGADYQKVKSSQTYRSVSDFGEFVSPELTSDLANLSNLSSYFTASYIHKNIGIELGGRVNNNSNYGLNYSYSINPYFKKSGFKAFGVIAKSYKNPSLYQVFSEYGNSQLKPQEAITFDVGLEYILKSSFKFTTVFFNRVVDNLFYFNSIAEAPFGQYINLDAQSENGLEIEVNKQWEKIQLFGNYTQIVSSNTLIGQEREKSTNLGFLRRPRSVFNAGLTYTPVENLTLSSTLQYQSIRQDRFYNSATFSSETVDLSAFTLLDVLLAYRFNKNFKAGLNVNNLLNQSYFEIYGYNSLPRNYSVNMQFSF